MSSIIDRDRSLGAVRSAYRQSGSRLASRIGSAAASALSIHYASHYLGPAEWGQAMAVVSLCLLLSGATDFGLGSLTAREVADPMRDANEAISDHMVLRLILSIAAVPVALAGAAVLYRGDALLLSVALIPLLVSSGMTAVASSALTGSGRSQTAGMVDLIGGVCGLGAALAGAWMRLPLATYLACVSGAAVVETASALVLLYRRPRLVRGLDVSRLWERLKVAAPMALVVTMNVVYLQADTVILATTRPAREVGAYSIAYAVLSFVMFAPSAFMAAILPGFMTADDHNRQRISQRSLDDMVRAAVPVTVLIALAAPGIVTILAGPSFRLAGPVLSILIPAAGLSFCTAVYGNLLVAVGRQSHLIPVVAAAAGTNILLNVALDPWFGPSAAAGVMVASEVVALVGTAAAFHRATGWRLSREGVRPALVGGSAMLLVGLAIHRVGGSGWWTLAAALAGSAVVYVGAQRVAGRWSLPATSTT